MNMRKCRFIFPAQQNRCRYFSEVMIYLDDTERYNQSTTKQSGSEGCVLNTKERVLAIRLMEKMEKHSEYVKCLGVEVVVSKADDKRTCL